MPFLVLVRKSNSDQIAQAYDDGDSAWLYAEISPRVKSLADLLNWEIGPYKHPDRTFVLSPVVRENLQVTRSVVTKAPTISGWHFLHAKPSKDLESLTFWLGEQTVCADGWRYQLISYNQGEFVDIVLFLDHSIANESIFCELVVESLLGEERRLESVGYINSSDSDADLEPDHLTPIRYLSAHLDQILGE